MAESRVRTAASGRFRTLVIQPLPGIGDMVWHLPHLHAIAAASPDERVSVLAKPRSRADILLRADESIDEVIWLERKPGQHDGFLGWFRLVDLLRRFGVQSVWVLHDSVRYISAAWFAQIPERRSFGFGQQRWFQTTPLHLPHDADRHPIAKADLLLKLHGLTTTEGAADLVVDHTLVKAVGESFAGAIEPWLAVGIGSSEPHKQWGRERFAELIRRLVVRRRVSIMIVGGAPDRPAAKWVIEQAGDENVFDATDLSVDVTAALLSRCRLYVGNDTGFLNIAAAVGVDALGLFGGSPPLRHSRHVHVVLPEGGIEAQYGDRYMERISVDSVEGAVNRLLDGLAGGG